MKKSVRERVQSEAETRCGRSNLCRCSTILDSPVTEQEFLEQLHELNNKINFAKELSFRETLACSDIQDIVDRLKLKVRRGNSDEVSSPREVIKTWSSKRGRGPTHTRSLSGSLTWGRPAREPNVRPVVTLCLPQGEI